MRWGEVKELARMLAILGVLVTVGVGLSAKTADGPGVVEVDVPAVPAVEQPVEAGPSRVGPIEPVPLVIRWARTAAQARPVGVPSDA